MKLEQQYHADVRRVGAYVCLKNVKLSERYTNGHSNISYNLDYPARSAPELNIVWSQGAMVDQMCGAVHMKYGKEVSRYWRIDVSLRQTRASKKDVKQKTQRELETYSLAVKKAFSDATLWCRLGGPSAHTGE